MPFKTKYTEADEKRVWDLFSQGMMFKQVKADTDLPFATIYRLLDRAIEKWGQPKPKIV